MPLFADLDPPPHGLVTLRARMARRHHRTRRWTGLILGPVAAATAALALWVGFTQPDGGQVLHALRFDHPALAAPTSLVTPVIEGPGGARLAAIAVGDGMWLVP